MNMPHPSHDQTLIGWAELDDAEALGTAPALRPADRRVASRFAVAIALLVLLSGFTGFVASTLFPAAPASRCAPHLALWEP